MCNGVYRDLIILTGILYEDELELLDKHGNQLESVAEEAATVIEQISDKFVRYKEQAKYHSLFITTRTYLGLQSRLAHIQQLENDFADQERKIDELSVEIKHEKSTNADLQRTIKKLETKIKEHETTITQQKQKDERYKLRSSICLICHGDGGAGQNCYKCGGTGFVA